MGEEQNIYTFSYKEIVEALVKKQGIHEGIWGIYIEFGIGAGNMPLPNDPKVFVPAAILPVQKIGLQKFPTHISPLTVDAAEVNPLKEEKVEGALKAE